MKVYLLFGILISSSAFSDIITNVATYERATRFSFLSGDRAATLEADGLKILSLPDFQVLMSVKNTYNKKISDISASGDRSILSAHYRDADARPLPDVSIISADDGQIHDITVTNSCWNPQLSFDGKNLLQRCLTSTPKGVIYFFEIRRTSTGKLISKVLESDLLKGDLTILNSQVSQKFNYKFVKNSNLVILEYEARDSQMGSHGVIRRRYAIIDWTTGEVRSRIFGEWSWNYSDRSPTFLRYSLFEVSADLSKLLAWGERNASEFNLSNGSKLAEFPRLVSAVAYQDGRPVIASPSVQQCPNDHLGIELKGLHVDGRVDMLCGVETYYEPATISPDFRWFAGLFHLDQGITSIALWRLREQDL